MMSTEAEPPTRRSSSAHSESSERGAPATVTQAALSETSHAALRRLARALGRMAARAHLAGIAPNVSDAHTSEVGENRERLTPPDTS